VIYDCIHRPGTPIDQRTLDDCLERFRASLQANGTDPGRWQIDGDRLYYFIAEGTTRPAAEGKLEGHRKYIDVQYVLEGVERIGCRLLDGDCLVVRDMPEQDAALYADCPGEFFVTVSAGQYAVFFPWDLHRPGCWPGEPAPVKKAVLKISVDLVADGQAGGAHEAYAEPLQ
jgi:YhcH/YjgK/YiaL family protein